MTTALSAPSRTDLDPSPAAPAPRRRRIPVGRVAGWCVLVVVMLVTLFPFYWMLRTALSSNPGLVQHPTSLLPVDLTLDGFRRALGMTTREEALNRVHRALQEFQVNGVQTNLGLLRQLVSDEEFVAGTYTTQFAQRHLMDAPPPDDNLRDLAAVAALAALARAQAARPATPEAFTSGWHRDSRRLPQ